MYTCIYKYIHTLLPLPRLASVYHLVRSLFFVAAAAHCLCVFCLGPVPLLARSPSPPPSVQIKAPLLACRLACRLVYCLLFMPVYSTLLQA